MRTHNMLYRPPNNPGVWTSRPFPQPQPYGQPGRNFQDVHTGGFQRGGWRNRFLEPTRGFGIDLNGNGRFDRGRDGVLVFDFNRDGKIDQKEISGTNNMMKAASGDYDFDGDGKVSKKERFMGAIYRRKFAKMDRNRDGKLSAGEISAGGGRIWKDRNRDGRVGKTELHSPFQVPRGWRRPSARVDVGTNGWSRITPNRDPWGPRPRVPHYPRPTRPGHLAAF